MSDENIIEEADFEEGNDQEAAEGSEEVLVSSDDLEDAPDEDQEDAESD